MFEPISALVPVLFGIFGLLAIVFGILAIFKTDLVWGLTVWQNDLRGLESKRTPAWERSTKIGGVFAVILGVIVLLVFVPFASQVSARFQDVSARYETIVPGATDFVATSDANREALSATQQAFFATWEAIRGRQATPLPR